MRRWWQILQSAFGGALIVACTVAGIEFFPAHAWLAGCGGAILGCGITIVMQYNSFLYEQRTLLRKALVSQEEENLGEDASSSALQPRTDLAA
jgi:hypothetical protein